MTTVKIATTLSEKFQIYRIRYEAWVEELEIEQPYADRENRLLEDPLDERGINFYASKPDGGIAGALRLNCDEFPQGLDGFFHLDRYQTFRPARFGYSSRMVIPPTMRGGLIGIQLFAAMCRHAALIDIPLIFCHGQPHIFALYQRVGFKRCGEDFQLPLRNAGVHTPMVLNVADVLANHSRLKAS